MNIFTILSNRSNDWTRVRKEFLKQNNSCKACGKTTNLEVHHIEPFHINPSRELDITNLITLCSSHHLVFGHLMDWKSWNINVIQDCEEYLNKVKNRPNNIIVQGVKYNYRHQIIEIIKKICLNIKKYLYYHISEKT